MRKSEIPLLEGREGKATAYVCGSAVLQRKNKAIADNAR